jgi:hypothetical protein
LPTSTSFDIILSSPTTEGDTMITAEVARSITDSSIANSKDSSLFKYAIEQVERYVKEAANRGGRYCSYNVDALTPGYNKPSLNLRKAVAEELKKNGFSYNEIWKNIGCVWFEVRW